MNAVHGGRKHRKDGAAPARRAASSARACVCGGCAAAVSHKDTWVVARRAPLAVCTTFNPCGGRAHMAAVPAQRGHKTVVIVVLHHALCAFGRRGANRWAPARRAGVGLGRRSVATRLCCSRHELSETRTSENVSSCATPRRHAPARTHGARRAARAGAHAALPRLGDPQRRGAVTRCGYYEAGRTHTRAVDHPRVTAAARTQPQRRAKFGARHISADRLRRAAPFSAAALPGAALRAAGLRGRASHRGIGWGGRIAQHPICSILWVANRCAAALIRALHKAVITCDSSPSGIKAKRSSPQV